MGGLHIQKRLGLLLGAFALVMVSCAAPLLQARQGAPLAKPTVTPVPPLPTLTATPLPPTPPPTALPRDIVTLVGENGDLSVLFAALASTGVVDTLRKEGPFTLFAPTNEAFAKLARTGSESTYSDAELAKLLDYHVALGRVMIEFFETSKTTDTLAGIPLEIAVTLIETWEVCCGFDIVTSAGNAQVYRTGIHADNGRIYIIDDVILRPDSQQAALTTE